jgi:hypothetical protein
MVVVIVWSGLIVGIYQTAINAPEEDGVEPVGVEPPAAVEVAGG